MAQLRDAAEEYRKHNTLIVIAGPDSPEAFKKVWNKEGLSFIGLPDPSHSVLKTYGQEVNLFKLGRMPAQVLVDSKGFVRFVHYGHSMADIPSNEEVLSLIAAL